MTNAPMAQEPSLTMAAITAGGTIVADLLVGFGIPVSPSTKTIIIAVISLLAVGIHAVVVRNKVFSPATVQRMEEIWKSTWKENLPSTATVTPPSSTPPVVTSPTVVEVATPPTITDQKPESL